MLVRYPLNGRRAIVKTRQRGKFELRGRDIDQDETLDSVLGPEGNNSVAVEKRKVGTDLCQYKISAPS